VDKRTAIQLDSTPRPLRLLLQGSVHAEASPATEAGVKARCALCGLREQAEIERRSLSASLAGVVTCHQLECGHAWHRTIANVGRIFPGLVRNATFVPCDCPHDVRHAR
jgi:hypothetical protein